MRAHTHQAEGTAAKQTAASSDLQNAHHHQDLNGVITVTAASLAPDQPPSAPAEGQGANSVLPDQDQTNQSHSNAERQQPHAALQASGHNQCGVQAVSSTSSRQAAQQMSLMIPSIQPLKGPGTAEQTGVAAAEEGLPGAFAREKAITAVAPRRPRHTEPSLSPGLSEKQGCQAHSSASPSDPVALKGQQACPQRQSIQPPAKEKNQPGRTDSRRASSRTPFSDTSASAAGYKSRGVNKEVHSNDLMAKDHGIAGESLITSCVHGATSAGRSITPSGQTELALTFTQHCTGKHPSSSAAPFILKGSHGSIGLAGA